MEFTNSKKCFDFCKCIGVSTYCDRLNLLLVQLYLSPEQLDSWFDPSNNGVNKEARLVNQLILETVKDSEISILDLTHLSEYRADAHPAIWLGKKDAVAIWGQDCMHWCLPGVPDTWVDILSQLINNNYHHLEMG